MSSSSEGARARRPSSHRSPLAVVRGHRAEQAQPVTLLVPAQRAAPVDLEALLRGARDEGFAAGRAAGCEEARAQGEEQRTQQLRALGESISAELQRCRTEQAEALTGLTQEAAELALALTETLLGRELAATDRPTRASVVRALGVRPEDCTAVTVRVHPDVIAELDGLAAQVIGVELTVLADPSVPPPGAVLAAGSTRIDAQLATALARVRRVLLGGAR